MNPMNREANAADLDTRYRTMLIIWAAILMSVCTMFVIMLLVEAQPAGQSNRALLLALAVASIFPFLSSFLIKHKLLAQSVSEQRPESVQVAMIVAVAMCEAVALIGMVAYFTTGTRYYYIFFIVGALGILLHMPRRDQLLAAAYKRQGLG